MNKINKNPLKVQCISCKKNKWEIYCGLWGIDQNIRVAVETNAKSPEIILSRCKSNNEYFPKVAFIDFLETLPEDILNKQLFWFIDLKKSIMFVGNFNLFSWKM